MATRRDFIKTMTLLAGGVGSIGVFPETISRAFAIDPAPGSTYLDAEHVVILMQENRAFDHVYGTMQGVRGFSDPRAFRQANNNLVWIQTNSAGKTYTPWRLDIKDTKATWMGSIPHVRQSQVDAWNLGLYDKWLDAKKSSSTAYKDIPFTLGHYTREDVPFYYALADAFTVCDQAFAGCMSSTDPNRLTFMTGTVRNVPTNATSKANIRNEDIVTQGASFSTFPELLEAAGISWKQYQNDVNYGNGLSDADDDWLGNYTATLEKFTQYKIKSSVSSLSGTTLSLHKKAFTTNVGDPNYHKLDTLTYSNNGTAESTTLPMGDLFYQFRQDVNNGALPMVSWLSAPHNYSCHPSAPWYGAWYVSEIVNILTQNPDVWKKTIFILTFDEGDGYFDHVPPFTCPNPLDPTTGSASPGIDAALEFIQYADDLANLISTDPASDARQGPIGLGYRIPLVVASPWSRGGWVNSQVFDHTSTLRFLETFLTAKTGKSIVSPNISQYRRTVSGDLTSCFRPYNNEPLAALPFVDRDLYIEEIYNAQFMKVPTNYQLLSAAEIASANASPATSPLLTKQEPGVRPSCANNYELYADGALSVDKNSFVLTLKAGNTVFGSKALGAPFNAHARNLVASPYLANSSYAVIAGDSLSQAWALTKFASNKYHVTVQGPNGFYREFLGSASDPGLSVQCGYSGSKITFTLKPLATIGAPFTVMIADNAYQSGTTTQVIDPTQSGLTVVTMDVSKYFGWYDFILTVDGYANFTRQYAGRVETGASSYTDPVMGGALAKATEVCSV